VVSAQENGDERKALDEIMTKLRTIVQETGIALFVVSHLKRPESKGHEEGAATSLSTAPRVRLYRSALRHGSWTGT